MTNNQPMRNTDRELFREDTGDPAGSYYENSVHVTIDGKIGMNVGGAVYVMTIAEWHLLAAMRNRILREGIKPCQDANTNICVAEGCYDEACVRAKTVRDLIKECNNMDDFNVTYVCSPKKSWWKFWVRR